MSVTVDRQPLPVQELGLETFGHIFTHLQKDNRLVVQVLIDGQEPGPGQIGRLRNVAINGHTVFIETANPRQLALEVLGDARDQLQEAERLKLDAADLLQRGQTPKALEQLGGCIRIWQHAQESVLKTSELLRIDLNTVRLNGESLTDVLNEFSGHLRQIKLALENRDYVCLSDVLLYETAETTTRWTDAIREVESLITQLAVRS